MRRPAVAGQFYPDDPSVLRRAVRQYLDEARLPADLGLVRAVIAPHAGTIYSGPIAGFAFRALETLPRKQWTVFLLGPSPLGDVPVAQERVTELLARAPRYVRAPEAHRAEHCLEVELPFLQVVLPEFSLVPMLFGEVTPQAVGADLAEMLGEDDLVVVSTDLSHYLPYAEAGRLDRALLDALLAGDQRTVGSGEACGRAAVLACMELARRLGWKPVLLDYRSSGDTAGDKWQVVGYAAVAYTA